MGRIAVSADRRFHRAHVKPARKRGRLQSALWPLLKLGLLTGLGVLAVYRGQAVLAEAPALRVNQILIRGNHRLPSGEVLNTLDGLRGENIVWTDLNAWRDRMMTSPWVRDATFRRSLPSTVEVEVEEREPVGIARLKSQLFLVDERGSIIDEFGPQHADFDLPIIDGLAAPRGAAAPTDPQKGHLAARRIP